MNKANQFVCDHQGCGKSFKAKKSLIEHQRIHNGEKPYECRYPGCGHRFTQYSSMQKHERTHSGDKPYECEVCHRSFTQVSNLKRHEKTHSNEKGFKCDLCDKVLPTQTSLKQHMETHEKEDSRQKYSCKICNKMYSNRATLRKHLKEHEDDLISTVYEPVHLKEEPGREKSSHSDNKIEAKISKNASTVKHEEDDDDTLFPEREASKFVVIEPNVAIKAASSDKKRPESHQSPGSIEQEPLQEHTVPFPYTFNLAPVFYTPPTNSNEVIALPSSDMLERQNSKTELTSTGAANSIDLPERLKMFKGVIRYKGEIYFLYDQYLTMKKPNGETIKRAIDNDSVNPSRCNCLAEVSHYCDYKSLRNAYQEIVKRYSKCLTLDMLLSGKNCNSMTCKCGPGRTGCDKCDCGVFETSKDTNHIIHSDDEGEAPHPKPSHSSNGDGLDECPLEDDFCRKIKQQGKENPGGHVCLCKITRKFRHSHGEDCGHPMVMHDGHVDYIVNGKLHHPDGGHCDDHGPICYVETISEDYAISMINSGALPECSV